jgi:hypothetical protein
MNNTDSPYFHYLSPKILPVFSSNIGTVSCLTDVQFILNVRSLEKLDGNAEITYTTYCDGNVISEEFTSVKVNNGKSTIEPVWKSFSTPSLGFVEITFGTTKPLFKKIIPEPGYSVLKTINNKVLTINSDMKYANPRIIQQIQQYSRFCMLHSSVYVDSNIGAGNSLMLINPYEQLIVVKIYSSKENKISRKIKPKSTCMVNLAELVDDGEISTIMLTANNRIITYDVRHSYHDQLDINNIDHLDPFSGYSVVNYVGFKELLGEFTRNSLRKLNIRPD